MDQSLVDRIAEAFSHGSGAGLLFLGAALVGTPLPATLGFFRDFGQKLVSAVCSLPDVESQRGAIRVPPPPLAAWVAAAPPMAGLEYLTEEVLAALWQATAMALEQELARSAESVEAYLRRQNPAWHVVGRICFHLAENPRDEAAPFAFLCTYARAGGTAAHKSIQHVPLLQALREYASEQDKPALLSLLAPVQRAAQHSPQVQKLVDSGQIYHPLRFTPQQAYLLLREVPALESAGVVVRLPDFWKARRPARPTVQIRIGEQVAFGSEMLLDFSVQVALGNETLTEEEWQTLLHSEEPLVRLRGQWVELDRTRLTEVLAQWQKVQRQAGRDGISFVEGMRLLAGAHIGESNKAGAEKLAPISEEGWLQVQAGAALSGRLQQLRDPASLGHIEDTLGKSLQATLRPYQQVGVRWLHLVSRLGIGACLADDMGLGKTVQVLALLLLRMRDSQNQPALLIAPSSLLANWCAEATRFAPSLRVLLVHPSAQTEAELSALNLNSFAKYDLVITSYGYLQRVPLLLTMHWGLVVLDEAQAIKNPGAKQTRAVKSLRASARLALTGTPVENRLSDLWSLFDFLCPGLLGTTTEFGRFVQRLAQGQPSYAPLRELVRPYILRRMKTDPRVIADLPDKTEVVAYCNLSRAQAALYQRAVEELAQQLAGLDGIKRRGAVLSCLMRLKQICNHPAQALGHGAYVETDSGKLQQLHELCETIAARQDKVLVFTQFRELCTPLAEFLTQVFGKPGLVLHGETEVRKRQQLVEQFQRPSTAESGGGPPFFVLSLKAGGTGLNLTAASHVIHFDRWWNPAVEDQATDRAYRIGQRKNVLCHKLVCRGTLEERVDAMLAEKLNLAGEVLATGGELPLTELSDREILRLLTLDVSRALGES